MCEARVRQSRACPGLREACPGLGCRWRETQWLETWWGACGDTCKLYYRFCQENVLTQNYSFYGF